MPKTIKEAKANLARAIVHAKIARQIIELVTKEGRMMLKDEEFHQLKDLALIVGNDVATIDSYLGSYGRMSFGSERFAVVAKKEK